MLGIPSGYWLAIIPPLLAMLTTLLVSFLDMLRLDQLIKTQVEKLPWYLQLPESQQGNARKHYKYCIQGWQTRSDLAAGFCTSTATMLVFFIWGDITLGIAATCFAAVFVSILFLTASDSLSALAIRTNLFLSVTDWLWWASIAGNGLLISSILLKGFIAPIAAAG